MRILILVLMIYCIIDCKSYSQIRHNNDLKFSLSTNYEHGFKTDIDDGGNFSIDRYSVNASLNKNLGDRLGLDILGSYSFIDFDFSDSGGFAELQPWNGINTTSSGFRLKYDINSKFTFIAGPQIKYSGERGADFSKSLTYGGLAGFTYSLRRTVLIGTGVYLTSRIEDNFIAYPGLILNWMVNNRFMISTLLTGNKSELGPKIRVNYGLHDKIDAALSLGYETHRFRLDDDGIAENGVGDAKVLPVWVSLSYKLNNSLILEIYSGLGFFGELEIEDKDGDRVDKEDFDTMFFIGGGIKIEI